jgi:hypothetical protein
MTNKGLHNLIFKKKRSLARYESRDSLATSLTPNCHPEWQTRSDWRIEGRNSGLSMVFKLGPHCRPSIQFLLTSKNHSG